MNLSLRDGQTTEAQSRRSELNEWQQYEKIVEFDCLKYSKISSSSCDDKVPFIRSQNDCE
jgi:hypothetical protein